MATPDDIQRMKQVTKNRLSSFFLNCRKCVQRVEQLSQQEQPLSSDANLDSYIGVSFFSNNIHSRKVMQKDSLRKEKKNEEQFILVKLFRYLLVFLCVKEKVTV